MKIKKFLAMVSLSAFVLTNVIPIGVLAGGENQKRRLKSVAYSSSDFKGYVDNFIVGHRKWFGLLTNKAKMEKLELSDVCDWYQSNCRRNHVGEYLAFLYSLVSSHKSWFKSDDVADFASGLCLDYTPGTYDDYLCIVQDLLSDLKRKFGEGDITDKIKGVSISVSNLDDYVSELESRVPISSIRKNSLASLHDYFVNAWNLYFFLQCVGAMAKNEKMF